LVNEVQRCLLCRSRRIRAVAERDRFVTASCSDCGAVVRVEFDPPDDPSLRGRIEVLVEPATKPDPDGTSD
jgi:hypothetical protein